MKTAQQIAEQDIRIGMVASFGINPHARPLVDLIEYRLEELAIEAIQTNDEDPIRFATRSAFLRGSYTELRALLQQLTAGEPGPEDDE